MRRVLVFFCDLQGTLIGIKDNGVEDYKKFNVILNVIKERFKVDNIILSIASSDSSDIIIENYNTLYKYVSEDIILGKQIYCDESNDSHSSKLVQMKNYIKTLENSFIVEKIIYADDCEFSHELFNVYLKQPDKVIDLTPSGNLGLSEINDLLIKLISEIKRVKLQIN